MNDADMDQIRPQATNSRRAFVKGALMTAAAVSAPSLLPRDPAVRAQQSAGIRSFDHVSFPLQNTDAMMAFYRALGLQVDVSPQICMVHLGDQKINFHQPELWEQDSFVMRAPAARPPCGDFCFVWEGSHESLTALLDRVGAEVIEGPAPRPGGRAGGTVGGTSRYIRDPDGNLVEFIIYA
jgi:catechol 2,3-dioxygenase-like lactoylglutathione lyase family enzyme